MPRTNFKQVLALLAMCGVIQAYAQTGTVMTSAQTVEALLQAENKAVFERANQPLRQRRHVKLRPAK